MATLATCMATLAIWCGLGLVCTLCDFTLFAQEAGGINEAWIVLAKDKKVQEPFTASEILSIPFLLLAACFIIPSFWIFKRCSAIGCYYLH